MRGSGWGILNRWALGKLNSIGSCCMNLSNYMGGCCLRKLNSMGGWIKIKRLSSPPPLPPPPPGVFFWDSPQDSQISMKVSLKILYFRNDSENFNHELLQIKATTSIRHSRKSTHTLTGIELRPYR